MVWLLKPEICTGNELSESWRWLWLQINNEHIVVKQDNITGKRYDEVASRGF
jgi:hypothetical protein